MPRFTFLRLIKSFVLFWVALVGLWLFLPSPSPPLAADLRDHLIQTSLSSGKVLHTVHKWHASYASPDASGHVRRPSDDCAGLLIDWRLIADDTSSAVLLEVGEQQTTLNLTDAVLKSAEDNQESESTAESKGGGHNALNGLYVSDTLSVEVRAGDEDHIINMPWFRWADMALFHNQMHGFTYSIELKLVAHHQTEKGSAARVEIWKASALAGADANHLLNPRPVDREIGLLASFSDIQLLPPTTGHPAALSSIHITDVKGDLPSKTYPIRSFILFYLAPFLTVCLFLAIYLASPVLTVLLPLVAVYVVIVALCWCVAVRRADYPGFAEWRESFWMTRWLASCCLSRRHQRNRRRRQVMIWGPSGPVYETERNETDSLIGSLKRGR